MRTETKTETAASKKISYANGDYCDCVHNGLGRLIEEKWYNAGGTLAAHNQYVYDGAGNIVKSIDNLAPKEYTYYYGDGKIVRGAEYAFTLGSCGVRTGKSLVLCQNYRHKGGRLVKVTEMRGGVKSEYAFTLDGLAESAQGKSVSYVYGDSQWTLFFL